MEATFPNSYPEASLAGKTARFAVKVKEVGAPETPTLDDEFAKSLGVEWVEKLRETVKQRLEQDRAGASRLKLKRGLCSMRSTRGTISSCRRTSSTMSSRPSGSK